MLRGLLLFVSLSVVSSCSLSDDIVQQAAQPIIDGVPHSGHPSVGYLLMNAFRVVEGSKSRLFAQQVCTATQIGDHTLAVAAHCLSAQGAANAGEPDPEPILPEKSFFLPSNPQRCPAVTVDGFQTRLCAIDSFVQNPAWNPENCSAGNSQACKFLNDIGIVFLAEELQLPHSTISAATVRARSAVSIVGYGLNKLQNGTIGSKHIGKNHICEVSTNFFTISGSPNTAEGDSGGPVFSQINGQEVLVGIISAGKKDSPLSFHVRTDAYQTWIESQVQTQYRNDDGIVFIEGETDVDDSAPECRPDTPSDAGVSASDATSQPVNTSSSGGGCRISPRHQGPQMPMWLLCAAIWLLSRQRRRRRR